MDAGNFFGDVATWVAAAVALLLGARASCKEGEREDIGKAAAQKLFAMPLALMRHHAVTFQGLLIEPAFRGDKFDPDEGFWEWIDFYLAAYSSQFLIANSQQSLALGLKDASVVAEVAGLCSVLENQLRLVQRRKECWREDSSIALRCVADIEKALGVLAWLPSLSNKDGCGINPERYYN
jgi:hypothetical protein